jgi:hypothetical protein
MSIPREAKGVRLIMSLFSREGELIENVIKKMERYFGPVSWTSENLIFNRTRYYEREMGWPLQRRFIAFSELIKPDSIVDIKLMTNKIEKDHIIDNKRSINIDPGYISLERLVLATGKNYIHRIYLRKGIYADLTLIFHSGTFMPLAWTYPDYSDEKVIACFNALRDDYLQKLRGKEGEEI